MLYTDVSESSVNGIDRSVHGATPQQFFVTGGMAPSLAHSLDPHISLCNNNWSVQSVAVDPKEHVQGFSATEILEEERSMTLDEVEASKETQKTLCRFRRGPKKQALQTFMKFKYRTTHTSEWAGEESLPGFRMLLAISLDAIQFGTSTSL
ncbi:hypothetical protein GOP47_0002411 [Adiantum capillus-veneris]|uniref:Uncharacterized protein n=1 Tax=Adiantum capillus-veneris TaxID=13818 RepID=A0A9D4VBP7_ADICA|nr:hypothetical protein GOP47_0002411 [Adiantum capillus-veneris]